MSDKNKPKDEIDVAFDKMAKGIATLAHLEGSIPAAIFSRPSHRLPRFIQLKIQAAEKDIDGGWKILDERQQASHVETNRVIESAEESIRRARETMAWSRKILAEPTP